MPPYRNYIYEYHAKITSGEIIAGKWIKKIYEIIINGLQKQEYFFNAKAANKAIRFIENFCHHSKGRNDLIKLELWQKAIVSVIFGIQDAEKIRIFREIFIVIGRKNGKSLFASAIIAYMAYLEPEYGQEIYCLEDFRDCYAVGGIDLSQTTDLTAASVVIQKDGTLYAFTQFFMPRGRLEYLQATDGVPYDIFVKKGLITLSGENYVDYNDVYGWFTMLLEDYGIRPLKIGYDRYSAQYLITDMANYGFHMDDVYQGENLTPVIREFEGIIKDGDFKIADNNLLKTHFLNVALKHNMETRKFRPIKIEQRAHIDGFVSVIDAMTVRQKYWEECGELLKNAA